MVELGETPIDQPKPLISVVNHDVVRLHVPVHDTFRVAVVQRLQHLVNVKSDIVIAETLIQSTEIEVTGVNVLHYECWRLCHWISHDVNKVNNVNSATKSLQDLDLTSDLSFFYWLEDLDNNSLVVQSIDTFVHLRVLSTSNFLNDLVVLL